MMQERVPIGKTVTGLRVEALRHANSFLVTFFDSRQTIGSTHSETTNNGLSDLGFRVQCLRMCAYKFDFCSVYLDDVVYFR